jgi:hypothetical protein
VADVETALTAWAALTFDAGASSERPPELETRLPWVTVERIGGTDERFSAHPRIAVDVFAASPDEAADLAQDVHEALMFLTGPVHGLVIRGISNTSGPSRRPESNPAVHRRGATYTVSLRPA